MKILPVYENLDTSFVNLSALIRHLRDRQFAGQVKVKLRGYDAKIIFDAKNNVSVEEHDLIAGRIAEGDEALQRLLIRARESGGAISVFEFAEEEIVQPPISAKAILPIAKPSARPPQTVISSAPTANGNGTSAAKNPADKLPVNLPNNFLNLKPENHAPLPLEFTNQVESRARRMKTSPKDWQALLRLVGELLGSLDEVLENADLSFPAMLDSARAEISDDYPFLNPASGTFYYANKTAEMSEKVNAKVFAASINEILRRVLERLADNPQFSPTYRDATQKILALAHQHKSLYDKFSITPRLTRILGV